MKLKIPDNLTQRAYRAIREEILKGKLNGRQRLTETFFAEKLGVSKSPIREALNRLEAEGLVVIAPRRGASVIQFTVDDVNEIYDLREILETAAVRSAAVDERLLSRLRAALREAEQNLRKKDKVSYILADADFHRSIAQASVNTRLRKILENMHGQMLILRHRTFELSSGLSVIEHERIVRALEKGDRETAASLMTKHIRAVRGKLLAHLKSHPEAGYAPPNQ